MNIFFGIRIMLQGACGLGTQIQELNLANLSPFDPKWLHLTLRYIKHADAHTVAQCVQILTRFQTTQFTLRVGPELGYFAQAKVLFAEIGDPSGDLNRLLSELSLMLQLAGIPYDDTFDPVHFHVSLGRWDVDSAQPLPRLARSWVVPVSQVHLLTNDPADQGRAYHVLGLERLDPNEVQLKHLAGNEKRLPPKTGHPAAA